MTLRDLPPAVITAWATLISAISTPFVAVFLFFMGRKVYKIEQNTDGMSKVIAEMSKEEGHREGFDKAAAEGIATAATLAQGQAEGRAASAPVTFTDEKAAAYDKLVKDGYEQTKGEVK